MQTTIILLVEQIVTALGGEFKVIHYDDYGSSRKIWLITKYQLNSLHSVDLPASDHPSDDDDCTDLEYLNSNTVQDLIDSWQSQG